MLSANVIHHLGEAAQVAGALLLGVVAVASIAWTICSAAGGVDYDSAEGPQQ